MTGDILVIGYGPVGKNTVERLLAQGRSVRVAQRKRPTDLPAGVPFVACDATDAGSVLSAVAGAAQVVLSIGFAYDGKIWQAAWPTAMRAVLDACAAHGARLVFFDNLYMLGPQRAPLVETMGLTDFGRKPAARAAVTRMWQAETRVRTAALRAPDFYGPGVMLSHIGETGLAAVAQGKPAMFSFNPDMPHDYAYVPDLGRAVVTLLDAPDDAFGRAWHTPCAPTLTTRQILEIGARHAGTRLKLRAIPALLFPLVALLVPFLREMSEMRFQWDRPYQVDGSDWAARFWADVTPFEQGIAATIASFGRK